MVLDDAAIRDAMSPLLARHGHDRQRLVISELGIEQGSCRADVAVVDDDALMGYEIKGETDTLRRLPGQVQAYSRVFDYATLVVAANHRKAAAKLLPDWWGIIEARKGVVAPNPQLTVVFTVRRVPKPNPQIDPLSLVQLLWRDEAYAALRKLGRARNMTNARRTALWVALTEATDVNTLRRIVRDTLRARSGWLDSGRVLNAAVGSPADA